MQSQVWEPRDDPDDSECVSCIGSIGLTWAGELCRGSSSPLDQGGQTLPFNKTPHLPSCEHTTEIWDSLFSGPGAPGTPAFSPSPGSDEPPLLLAPCSPMPWPCGLSLQNHQALTPFLPCHPLHAWNENVRLEHLVVDLPRGVPDEMYQMTLEDTAGDTQVRLQEGLPSCL